jgi:EmrB/QacA subfamily drug resistance transporter
MDPYKRRWWALLVLCLALVVVSMDNLIVNVALPTLVHDLHASASQLQWIVDAYILLFACALLPMGSLGDRFGRRRALYTGLLVFAGGSVASAFATSAEMLVGTRAVMGLGAAVVCPATLSIITNIFPDKERAKAISTWASFAALGIVLGPTVGGWLLEHFWWGSVFLINVPIVVAVVAAIALIMPDSRDPQATPLDPLGALLATTGLVSLVFAIIEAPHRGWTDPLVVGAFAVSAPLLVSFVGWELRRKHPMLPIGLFRNPRFSAASLSLTLMFFANNGLLFLLTQHLQFVLGYSPIQAGVRVLPVATLAVAAPLAPWLVGRFGTARLVAAGMLIQALGGWLLTGADAGDGYRPVGVALAVFGLGLGLSMGPATDSVMGSLPLAKAGVGSAMNDTTRSVGGALGVAVLGSVLSSVYASSMDPALTGLPAQLASTVRDSVGAATQAAAGLGGAGQALVDAARSAFVDGMHTAMLVGVAILAAGAFLSLVFMPSSQAPATAEQHTIRTPVSAGHGKRTI